MVHPAAPRIPPCRPQDTPRRPQDTQHSPQDTRPPQASTMLQVRAKGATCFCSFSGTSLPGHIEGVT